MMNPIYTENVIASLELGWGEGWLSPGGDQELEQLVDGVEISGKQILDIGVGAGGPALTLLQQYGAAKVTGIDIEQTVLDRTAHLAEKHQLQGQLDLHCVKPGKLPFENASFDIVFSKDSFVHIADKQTLFDEIYRVLIPGGVLVFSDWCCGTRVYSPEMNSFLENGMGFSMASAGENLNHMICSGFEHIRVKDRNHWFTSVAEREYADAVGVKQSQLIARFNADKADRIALAARRRSVIGQQGHLRPTHFRSQKLPESKN